MFPRILRRSKLSTPPGSRIRRIITQERKCYIPLDYFSRPRPLHTNGTITNTHPARPTKQLATISPIDHEAVLGLQLPLGYYPHNLWAGGTILIDPIPSTVNVNDVVVVTWSLDQDYVSDRFHEA